MEDVGPFATTMAYVFGTSVSTGIGIGDAGWTFLPAVRWGHWGLAGLEYAN